MRAVSVRVNEVIGVAGFTVPGTRVDVLVTVGQQQESMARIVVTNVQVLTAGTRYDMDAARADAEPIPSSVVTLLVTPSDAERIAAVSPFSRANPRSSPTSFARRPPKRAVARKDPTQNTENVKCFLMVSLL